jgi:prepilin-type N-terminal cleavage/methylation domain-containing protein
VGYNLGPLGPLAPSPETTMSLQSIRTARLGSLALARSASRAAFTLVELLAVILIISLLMFFLLPKIPEAIDTAKVTGCKKNMQEIYSGFQQFETKFGRGPSESGVRFFAELISMKVWENTKNSVSKLNCPQVPRPPGTEGMKENEWYVDLAPLDGSWSSYAGRDNKRAPLKRWQNGEEPLVADDNDGGMNHRTATVVLYGDGSAQTFELGQLIKEGVLQKDEKVLVVGIESPVEDLQKLSLE